MPRACGVLLAASAAIACAEENTAQAELSIAPDVLAAMGELQEVSRAQPVQRLTQRLAMAGPAQGAEVAYELTSLGRNLYGARVTSVLGKQVFGGTSLTMCGLVELLSTSQAPTTERTAILAVPIGSLFLPLGIRMQTDFSSSSQATRLSMSAPAAQLCQPVPDMTFSYELDTVSRLRTKSGLARFNSTILAASRSSCTVQEARPVSPVIDGAEGNYLPVSCEAPITVGKSGKPNAVRRELAYLPEAGFYVTLTGHDRTAVQFESR